MNLAAAEGMLNLAGVRLFAERPEWFNPQFVVKAIRYPGNEILVSDYTDTEDFSVLLRKVSPAIGVLLHKRWCPEPCDGAA